MFQSKLLFAAFAAVALVVGGLAISAADAAHDVELLTAQVEQLKSEQAVKQSEVNALAAAVELSDYTLSQVLAERESIAAIRAQADAEQARLRTELDEANAQVAKLRVSTDEHVKDWANTVMPTNAVRLLKYATAGSNNQNGDGDQSGLQNTTARVVSQLPADYSF